ncbi:hypothetical protein [Cellulomonas sp. URHD0024]|uniref:hypothetical protein n=1 Tax=Cellulomonas sp. URHD0024 TaxID=1302620 RepID=UPI00040C8491|nr:hypothetical protein [Cellulomonas sp. URHD0024]
MNTLVLLTLFNGYLAATRRAWRERAEDDSGMTTLETVIITLVLIAVATAFGLALTAAIQRRTNQIT